MYENFTDVDSIFVASPAHVHNPVGISNLTYREMRELSYAGFTVVHDEALYPAFAENIPVVVKNTNNPEAPGTMITEKKMTENKWPIAGIASHGGFASVYITKYMMNREVGFMRRVLSVFEEYECSVEHVVSGIDDIDVIFKEEQLSAKELDELLLAIQTRTAADKVEKRENLCLLMIVGESMQSSIGITARATKALSQANINLEMINQGSSENSVMFGIKENKEAEAVRAIYDEFFEAED